MRTIAPSSDLPPITSPVVIDGHTQPGASPNTLATGTNAALEIELSGTNTSGSGLRIGGLDSSISVIRGLAINRFSADGIFVSDSVANVRIEGNFIGTDPSGTIDHGHNIGVVLTASSGTAIGGNTPAARNLISGNEASGIDFEADARANKILGNLIGTTARGTTSLANGFYGVGLFGTSDSDNKIGDGSSAGANTIAFNGRDGIEIDFPASATGNTISRNSIFSNGGLGIDLLGGNEADATDVPTPNDAGDADTGTNNLQNKPVLSSAKNSSTGTTIVGKLNSTPGKTFEIQFFSNPSGNEGKTFIGKKSVATDGSGNASFTFSPASKVPAGRNVTATAMKTSTGDTSEFAAPRTVASS